MVTMSADSTGGTSQGSGKPPVFDFQSFLVWLRERDFEIDSLDLPRHLYSAYGFQRLVPYFDFIERAGSPSGCRTLDTVRQLVEFDESLRMLILRWSGVIEMQVRSQYRQAMFDAGGPYCLYDESFFINRREWASSLHMVSQEVRRQANNNVGARRALADERGRIPIWTAIDAVAFGTLRRLYGNTSVSEVTTRVAASFNVNKRCFKSWLRTLVAVRNCCAHFNPYSVRVQIPAVPKPVFGYEADNSSPLYVLAILDRLLQGRAEAGTSHERDDWHAFRRDAEQLVGSFSWKFPALCTALRVPSGFTERYVGSRLPVVRFDRGIRRESIRIASLAA